MDRRTLLRTAGGGLLILSACALAQPQVKQVRIGFLDYSLRENADTALWNAFRDQLRELGYIEGENVAFERRSGNGQAGRLPKLAVELIDAKVDIIVTAGSEAARAAKAATNSIPIVTASGSDPVELGLVASLARPGGNITGVTSVQSELSGKRLELLQQLLPRATRVAVLWDSDNHSSAITVRDTETSAKAGGVALQIVGVRDAKDIVAAFAAMTRERADAVLVISSPGLLGERRLIADLAATHRVPTVVGSK